jgi:hypothetical protein
VLGRRRLVKKIQKAVVGSVHEKLGSTRVGLAGVGHGQSHGFVGILRAASNSELVLDGTATVSLLSSTSVGVLVGGVGGRASRSGTAGVGVLTVGAAELNHEVGNGSVDV